MAWWRGIVAIMAGGSWRPSWHPPHIAAMVIGDIGRVSKGAEKSRLCDAASEAMGMPSGSMAFDMAVVHPPWARCWPRRHSTSGLAQIWSHH